MNTRDTNAHMPPFRVTLFGAVLLVLPLQVAQAADPAIEKLREQISQLQSQVTNLTAQVTTLESKVGSVQAPASLLAIAPYVSLETVNDLTVVRFTGVNVQVVNGKGSTATANGTGNLIVGYNEADTSGRYRCTLGMSGYLPIANEAACVYAGGRWLNTGFKTGSHYLVVGSGNNYSRWGGIVAGFRNTNNFDYASVSDGYQNSARGDYSSMSGGGTWASSGGGDVSGDEDSFARYPILLGGSNHSTTQLGAGH